jgi:hypothetical protein
MQPRPGLDAGGLDQHLVAASGHLPKLGNRVGEIPLLLRRSHDGPVHGDAKKLVRSGQASGGIVDDPD